LARPLHIFKRGVSHGIIAIQLKIYTLIFVELMVSDWEREFILTHFSFSPLLFYYDFELPAEGTRVS
jgi:hypothetical protein